ncbi:hypothetical protein CYMTET_34941, partial [Cymbomonas tetramitiformis]
GYFGTGEVGCRVRGSCLTENGGCDPLTSCISSADSGDVECGGCPAGYSGTGDTACVDTDGCAQEPCFPGVECADTPAPGEGRTCGTCPEGFWETWGTCEPCDLQLTLDPLMATVIHLMFHRVHTLFCIRIYFRFSEFEKVAD